MIQLRYHSIDHPGEVLTAYFNPLHIVYVSGTVDNVNITPSTGVGIGHNFLGDPRTIALAVAESTQGKVISV